MTAQAIRDEITALTAMMEEHTPSEYAAQLMHEREEMRFWLISAEKQERLENTERRESRSSHA